MSYFNACDVTIANSNHKNFLQFFWRALVSLHFEQCSATHVWYHFTSLFWVLGRPIYIDPVALPHTVGPGKKATVPVNKVLVRPGQESNSWPAVPAANRTHLPAGQPRLYVIRLLTTTDSQNTSGGSWTIWLRMQSLVCVSMTSSYNLNDGTVFLQKLPSNCDSNTMPYLLEFQLLRACRSDFPNATHVCTSFF